MLNTARARVTGHAMVTRICRAFTGWWRLLAFSMIIVASLYLGVHFKETPTAGLAISPPSQNSIMLFTSDPAAQVKLRVEVSLSGVDLVENSELRFYLTIIPPRPTENVRWAIRIAGPVPQVKLPILSIGSGYYVHRLTEYSEGIPTAEVTVAEGDSNVPGPGVLGIAPLPYVPPPAVQIPRIDVLAPSGYSAHLPTINNVNSDVATQYVLEYSKAPSPARIVAATFDPQIAVPGAEPLQLLSNPLKLDVTETLLNGGNELEDSQVTSLLPQNGQVVGNDLVWHSTHDLSPSVSSTKISYAEDRAANDFYSGLAFATSAAALIAAVQELPRRRRVPTTGTSGAAPDPPRNDEEISEQQLTWEPNPRSYM